MFEIRLNGKKFTLWETASLQRSIDMNSGVFQFTSTTTIPSEYPVKPGDKVQIIIDGQTKLNGAVDVMSATGNKETGQTVRVSGRDNVADLIDSSIPDSVKTIKTPVSLTSMCEQVIAALGLSIKVINNVTGLTDFEEDVQIDADSGKKCMDFLVDFARKKQVYLIADGEGNLIIFRPSGVKSGTTITQEKNGVRNNVREYSHTLDDSQRYFQYRVRSQDNFGASDDADYKEDGVNRTGESTPDTQIRSTRFLEIQGEETMTDAESTQRANEESNIRRARGFEYIPTLVGSSQNDGTLWDFGLLVPVKDQVAGVNGTFLIRSLSYSMNINSGTTTQLNITRPEAYKVLGAVTQKDARIAPTDSTYQKSTPDDSIVFVRKKGTLDN